MTAACLTLLHRIQRPVWPFAKAEACGLVVEAFPAAQLRKWALPFDRYNGRGELAKERRATIVQALRQRVRLETFMASLLANADALDAVLCCFAGIAVTTSQLARHPSAPHPLEGAIAVHI